MEPGISVILLTWNGVSLLKECLPKVVDNLSRWDIPYEFIIVDNGSSDGSIEYLKEMYGPLRPMAPTRECRNISVGSVGLNRPFCLIEFPQNLGFAKANNLAVKQANFQTVLFLNNDIYLEDGFITPLYERLQNEKVFAVAPKILRWDKETIDDGLRYGRYYSGLFSVELESERAKYDVAHWVTFFCGACFLCKKRLFIELEGFDTLYTPYAWEDLDLAYRAWKRGYTIAYEPRSVAYHKREATTRSAFSNVFFVSLMWRNKFIFMWKNIRSPRILVGHLAWLPVKLMKFLLNGRWRYVIGFLRALPYVPIICLRRIKEKKNVVLQDEDVLRTSYRTIEQSANKT
ncbi:MAG: glycosyltransferase family 2 protein [Candidatus Omnitrophica bacterium]|nr:glycosyltransferase family 2 protein [Candidatus Omnitrophota bacterium]